MPHFLWVVVKSFPYSPCMQSPHKCLIFFAAASCLGRQCAHAVRSPCKRVEVFTAAFVLVQEQHAHVRDQESSPQPSRMDDTATSGPLAPLQIPVPFLAQSQEADTPTQDAGERETFFRALPEK